MLYKLINRLDNDSSCYMDREQLNYFCSHTLDLINPRLISLKDLVSELEMCGYSLEETNFISKEEDEKKEEVGSNTSQFKEIPYTIEIDWNGGTIWLNNHVAKEKLVLTKKDSESISDGFLLIDVDRRGFLKR